MARIRSIHPGLFTDEAFAMLGADAQMLLIGLWTEADDQGIFEWKPMTLRMRLRPAKDGAVEPLLSEIVSADCIMQFEIGDRQYGAIRNFRKYQRPKKPNSIHPITDEIRTYVALTTATSELDGDEEAEVLPKGEIFPQRKEEGGRMEDEGGNKKTSVAASQPPPVALVPFIEIPTNRFETTGEQHPVYEPLIEEFQRLYPAVDVRAELRKMRGWALTNSGKCKTKRGMKAFINRWLTKQQDKPAPRETFNGGRNGGRPNHTSSISQAADERSYEGLFTQGGGPPVVAALEDNSGRDQDEDGRFGRAADAA